MTLGVAETRLVLQAGGRGQRMGDVSRSIPKPMQTVGGTPMVERLLRQGIDAGLRRITVITGEMGDRITAHLRGLEGLPSELDLGFIAETVPRGNIGALADLPRDGRRFVLCFADLVTDLDFATLLAVHQELGSDVTLASHPETHRLALGELVIDGDRVVDYREKPEKRFLICSGIGVFEPALLDLVPLDRPAGISDLISLALAHDLKVMHWTHGAFWMDVNSQEDLARANGVLARIRPAEGRS